MQRTALVLPCPFPCLGQPVHAPPAPHDALHVIGRARTAHRQQARFGLRRGYPSQRADLGVGQLAASQGLGEQWECLQRAGDPNAFPGGAWIEADAPAQPGGAGAEAGVPAAPRVELANQIEEAGGGGFEMRRQLGDLIAQPIQVRGRILSGNHQWRVDLHGTSPPAERLYTPISEPRRSVKDERLGDEQSFGGQSATGWPTAGPRDLLGRDPQSPLDVLPMHAVEAVKQEVARWQDRVRPASRIRHGPGNTLLPGGHATDTTRSRQSTDAGDTKSRSESPTFLRC